VQFHYPGPRILRRPIDIPPAYSLIQQGGLSLLLRDDYQSLLLQTGIGDIKKLLKKHGQPLSHLVGRVPHLAVSLSDGKRLVVRRYSHGGLLQSLTRDLYLLGSRGFEELILTEGIRSSGIATVQPVGAIHQRVFPFFYRAYFLSIEIPGARDLSSYFQTMGPHPCAERLIEKRRMIRSVGRLVRQFHEAGFFHRDLQLKNILASEGKPFLIDFDRSYRKSTLTLKERIENLLRLNRSAEKWKRAGLPITKTDRWRFFLAYSGEDEQLREALRNALRKLGFYAFFHPWFWALKGGQQYQTKKH